MEQDRSLRIRERAYALWERDGRPDGQQERHWREAEAAILTEQSGLAPDARLAEAIARHITEETPRPRRTPRVAGGARQRSHA
ncbi:DUF2934 domain-containing protein [Azospirillum endophyticum]|nr:DUF2934 domain-containing protein [Azospirillum endophyticum]